MNTWGLSALGRLPVTLWHRFNVWRARRMYAEVVDLSQRAEWLMQEADELMRRHAESPQQAFKFGGDD